MAGGESDWSLATEKRHDAHSHSDCADLQAAATSDRQVTVVASVEQLMGVSVIQIARACELITAIDLTGIAGLQVLYVRSMYHHD